MVRERGDARSAIRRRRRYCGKGLRHGTWKAHGKAPTALETSAIGLFFVRPRRCCFPMFSHSANSRRIREFTATRFVDGAERQANRRLRVFEPITSSVALRRHGGRPAEPAPRRARRSRPLGSSAGDGQPPRRAAANTSGKSGGSGVSSSDAGKSTSGPSSSASRRFTQTTFSATSSSSSAARAVRAAAVGGKPRAALEDWPSGPSRAGGSAPKLDLGRSYAIRRQR